MSYKPTRVVKSSFCASSGCIEVDFTKHGVLVTSDSDLGIQLFCTIEEWHAFIAGVKAGEFDG